jgi:alkylhydroperoxidase family enzyme
MSTKPLTRQPTGAEVAKARKKAGLTQAQAAELVYLGDAVRWSNYEREVNGMPLATWELFLFKTGQRKLAIVEE